MAAMANVALDSLLNQDFSFTEYEIILINDDSTDDSFKIIKDYAERYDHIIIVNQTNKGVAVARNNGIIMAKGEYICFVDADDYLVTNGLSYVYKKFVSETNKADVIRYWCLICNKPSVRINNLNEGSICYEGFGLNYIKLFGLETFCWNMLYKKSFLIKNNIYFSSYIFGEDYLFATTVFLNNP